MGRPRRVRLDWAALATIWEVSDALWAALAPVIATTGRRRVDARAIVNALIFRMRSGCQWNQLPERFPDDSTIHRTFQRWVRLGLFERLWAVVLEHCDELGGVDWQWQAADGAMGKARLGGGECPRTTQHDLRGADRAVWAGNERANAPVCRRATTVGSGLPTAARMERTE